MVIAQSDYVAPAYTGRSLAISNVIGGAATTTYAVCSPPASLTAMRVRSISAIVTHSNTAASTWTYYNGTTSLGKFVFGTASGVAANTVLTIADLNATITAGNSFGVVSGADAAGTAIFTLELQIDPSSTYSGNS